MKFGASVWPFSWQPPYDEALRRIAALGYKSAELIAWNREALDSYYTRETIQHLRSLMNDLDLELSEFVSTPQGMASPDPAVRAAAVEHFRAMVDVALELGTRMVNTVSPNAFGLTMPHLLKRPLAQLWSADLPPGRDWEENWSVYVEVTRRCCEICESMGVRYALEPHPFRWVRNAASMMRLVDHVRSPALGMNFDPSHLFPSGEISEQVVYELGDRLFHAHFSDNDGMTNAHWRPGKGKIDWRAVLAAMQDIGFDGVISIELEDVPGTARDNEGRATSAFDHEMRLTLDYMRELCAELNIEVA